MPYRISVVFHQSCKRFSTSECVIRNRNGTQSFFFNHIFKCVHLSLYEVLSVRRSIRLSVRPYGILGRVHTTLLRHYVGPSVITSRFWRSELKGEQIWVTDPAQVYTALALGLVSEKINFFWVTRYICDCVRTCMHACVNERNRFNQQDLRCLVSMSSISNGRLLDVNDLS